MVQSNDEYPFWARWLKRVDGVTVPTTDITSVSTAIKVYNPATNVFDLVSSASVSAADSDGRWIQPFTIPVSTGYKKYQCVFAPVGGAHQTLIDEVDTLDGVVYSVTGGGTGTETHSGTVCYPADTPLPGVLVRAIPYGTTFTWATAVTNSLGEYTLTGLVENHAYSIEFNKDGYWTTKSGVVIA